MGKTLNKDVKKKKISVAVAHVPATTLGGHRSQKIIKVDAHKGEQSFGTFSIGRSGIRHKDENGDYRYRSWRSLEKFIDKGKKLS